MIEHILAEAQAEGFKLNNLCQMADGTWRANFLVDVKLGAEFGVGPGAAEALRNALDKAIAKRGPRPVLVVDNTGAFA